MYVINLYFRVINNEIVQSKCFATTHCFVRTNASEVFLASTHQYNKNKKFLLFLQNNKKNVWFLQSFTITKKKIVAIKK